MDDEAPTLPRPTAGQILGERYQMRELLGRGGMGEVWRAFDLKLRVDVALKSVRPERLGSERAHELLRQEVRSAREVVSPNVCRIFDLEVEEGRELVSMEYIDGTTLTETLRQRGPLDLREAREIASQFLSGLEAIHQAGLVHRDFKPENVMLTRAGRVVVMDFGLAKGLGESKVGSISGTPAYMAPEQACGDPVDARADVYAAGVVLAEMLGVGGEDHSASRQALWKAVRESPPRVQDGPWTGVLRRTLSSRPEDRPESARALARALDEVTLRLPGFEGKRPYPGLASFKEEDAEYFFGREAEVEAVWTRLKQPRLLALIGPSGTGKSSFVQAGLLPTLPPSWAAIVATPGRRPQQALGQALAPSLAGDAQAVRSLLRFEEADTAVELVSRWRQHHEHALIVVDQFEELFTLNPPEVQTAFAELLGRLVLEADVQVLLSLRDDFLFRCHGHEALAPILSELTLLGPLGESGLRRALVQPALACGHRFEDDALVEEMIEEVGRERGTLPLLAFAASRLWEKRDRERGLLTREAYHEIGGVAGALAQHAEATLERIGTHRTPLVRELLRNLVTAQGTRAVRERSELLSVFEKAGAPRAREEADEVLGALIDARLLTSFDTATDDSGESRQEIEIVHESLLSRWPRLVRWQTQDADGAQLRDQLRQAALGWQDRGRPEDLLWTGTAYRDLALWRERYLGGLTANEDAFARASAGLAGRRRRRRRAAVAALLGLAATVAIVMSVLWQQARDEALRAEASRLITLGQAQLESYPTAAVAHALKSLELADTPAGRLFAVRARQHAPVALLIPALQQDRLQVFTATFSPDGQWLALGGYGLGQILHRDGRAPTFLEGDAPLGGVNAALQFAFGPAGDLLVGNVDGAVRVWTMPAGAEAARAVHERGPSRLWMRESDFVTATLTNGQQILRSWPLRDLRDSRVIGSLPLDNTIDLVHDTLAVAEGRRLYLRAVDASEARGRLLAEHPAAIRDVRLSPDGTLVAALGADGEARVWATAAPRSSPLRVVAAGDVERLNLTSGGRWLAAFGRMGSGYMDATLFDLSAPPASAPRRHRLRNRFSVDVAFDAGSEWAVGANTQSGSLWRTEGPWPHVLRGHEGSVFGAQISSDGRWLVSSSSDGTVRLWRLSPGGPQEARILARDLDYPMAAVDPAGRFVAVVSNERQFVVPLAGGPPRSLPSIPLSGPGPVAITDDGRLVAHASAGLGGEAAVFVWDLESETVRILERVPGVEDTELLVFSDLEFVDRDRLLVTVGVPGSRDSPGTLLYDLRDGGVRRVSRGSVHLGFSRSGGFGVGLLLDVFTMEMSSAQVIRFTLDGEPPTPLASHGTQAMGVALDPVGSLVASSSLDGTIRVGLASGEEPHFFFGPEGFAFLEFSPDSRWLVSAHQDGTIRLWPAPNVERTPLHVRPYEELLSGLRSHTNLRVVPDPESATGYRLELGPFPGWATPPKW